MRWGGVGERNLRLGLTLGLALHQEGDAAAEHIELPLLPGDDSGEVVDRADEVRDALFDIDQPVHRRPPTTQAGAPPVAALAASGAFG